jgi:hypothetical protein
VKDTRHIIRQWDRELAADRRREEAAQRQTGPWRYVTWTALWLLWLAVLAGALALLRPLYW